MQENLRSVSLEMMDGERAQEMESQAQPIMVVQQIDFLISLKIYQRK